MTMKWSHRIRERKGGYCYAPFVCWVAQGEAERKIAKLKKRIKELEDNGATMKTDVRDVGSEHLVGGVWDNKRALEVYSKVFPDDKISPSDCDPREFDIVEEMNMIKMADTVDEAVKVIAWWGWWGDTTAEQTVKRIRRFSAPTSDPVYSEYRAMSFQDKCKFVRGAKKGSKWINRKSGIPAFVVGHFPYGIRLRRETGRATATRYHYFAYDYFPVSSEA